MNPLFKVMLMYLYSLAQAPPSLPTHLTQHRVI